jgi:hypothetical protein
MLMSDEDGVRHPLGSRELYVDTTKRGSGGSRHAVGAVTYGRWQLGRLGGTGRISDLPRPDPARWDLYLAVVPHSLRFGKSGDAVSTVNVGFEITNVDASAYDLLPRSVTGPRYDAVRYVISSSLRFTSDEGVLRGSGYQIDLSRLHPITTAEGIGENSFGWQYQAPSRDGVSPGYRQGYAILQIPRGCPGIHIRAAAVSMAGPRSLCRSEPLVFTADLPQ